MELNTLMLRVFDIDCKIGAAANHLVTHIAKANVLADLFRAGGAWR
jgi:hypothetical protein